MIVPYDPPLTERESGFQIALSQERIDHCITKRKIAALEAERNRLRDSIESRICTCFGTGGSGVEDTTLAKCWRCAALEEGGGND